MDPETSKTWPALKKYLRIKYAKIIKLGNQLDDIRKNFQRGIYKVWAVQAKFDYTFQEVQYTILYTNIWMFIVLKGTVSKIHTGTLKMLSDQDLDN